MTSTTEQMREAYDKYGTFNAAARALGIPRTTLRGRLHRDGFGATEPPNPERDGNIPPARLRAMSNRLLARLLKYHGDNPPDSDAAKAVARYRKANAPVPPPPLPVHDMIAGLGPVAIVVDIAKKRTSADILAQTAEKHGMTKAGMLSRRKDAEHVQARQEAMWLMYHEIGMGLSAIGRAFRSPDKPNGIDHTTVIHGIRKHQERIEAND